MSIEIGDIVVLHDCGDSEKDLMCSGFNAVVKDIQQKMAFVDGDEYVRSTRIRQAVSFRQWWPIDNLTKADA